VGVAIHEAGGDPAALAVDPLGGIPTGREIFRQSGKGNPAILGGNGSALDDPKTASFACERCKASVTPNAVESHGRPDLSLCRLRHKRSLPVCIDIYLTFV
jgi:hypothetical protein